MTERQFTRREIEGLADKLDPIQSQLTERERELLLAIFSAARDGVRPAPAGAPETAAATADLREQLLNAFIPGGGTSFIIADIKVGPGPGTQVKPE